MRTLSAIILGKSISFISRKFNLGGGSAAPGLYALKLDSQLVKKLSSKIPTNIIITGTNGKTTTARMVVHFAKEVGLKVIRNHTGSNLERGIASTLIQNSRLHLRGVKLNDNLGIWELDEFAFNSVALKLKPDLVVFLNVSRDQLDRYGEVDKVVNRWCETLVKLDPRTIVLINADDPNLDKLEKHFKGRVIKFSKKNIKNIKFDGLAGSTFRLTINDKQGLRSDDLKRLTINLPLPGLYHIYDFLAAFYAGHELGFSSQKMISSLKSFRPAFGRVEKLDFGYIFLIKNPAGATQVFQTISPQIKPGDRLLLALNDNLADGTDVSWIWDAQFENLKSQMLNVKCFVSGTRAYDLANRLKYAGFDPKQIKIEPDLENALREARKGLKGHLFILPTYTAMLELQGILTKSGIKKNYWEEN